MALAYPQIQFNSGADGESPDERRNDSRFKCITRYFVMLRLFSHALKHTLRAPMQNIENDQTFMQRALALAEHGKFTASPNPMVGCVVVKDGEIIAEGFHEKSGCEHAEIVALNIAGEGAKNATLYVTLEPCCHHGKTPPCVETIIELGVKRVVVAMLDPNPLVHGKSIKKLKSVGIEVTLGILEEHARKLNQAFIHYITTKRPFVHAKWAMSLDGKTVTNPQQSRHITSKETQNSCHSLRASVDAIVVGKNTVLHDNPKLNIRQINGEVYSGKQPVRIIVTTDCDIPLSSYVISDNSQKTLIVTSINNSSSLQSKFQNHNHVTILGIECNISNKIDINQLLQALGEREIASILVEGGMTLLQSFIEAKAINNIHVFIAPLLIPNQPNRLNVRTDTVHQINQDFYISGTLNCVEENTHV